MMYGDMGTLFMNTRTFSSGLSLPAACYTGLAMLKKLHTTYNSTETNELAGYKLDRVGQDMYRHWYSLENLEQVEARVWTSAYLPLSHTHPSTPVSRSSRSHSWE
jgi:hypothetical protein